MLFQFNYQFLSRKQFNITSTTTSKPNGCQKLKAPDVNGPVDHVAFVIHGIGQQTEKFGFFQKHLQSLFDTTNNVVEENRPHKQINVQYVPIEWHKHIHEETDTAMDDITLRSIPSMRMVNNDYLADAFFYLSKERGQSIVTHVTNTFNAAYAQFMKANPGFNGKIAILAYSLGGIITWDILSNQPRPNITKKEIRQHSKLDLDFPTLNFKPDYLFNLGSPLSAFLTVRNQDPKLYHPDPSIAFENIFHPFDPLAYRFEPMLNIDYKHQTAVLIDDSSCSVSKGDHHLYRNNNEELHQILGGNNMSGLFSSLKRYFSSTTSKRSPFPPIQQEQDDACMQEQDAHFFATSTPKLSLDCGTEYGDDDDEDAYSPIITTPNSTVDSDPFIYTQTNAMMTSNYAQKKRSSFMAEEEKEQVPDKKRRRKSTGSSDDHLVLNTTITKSSKVEVNATTLLSEPGNNRIDHVLRPERFMGFLQKNEYISGLTAHFSYWTNKDLMWHIVRRLEQDV